MREKKRILLTGGAGYIGSHVNEALHRAGFETLVYDNLSSGRRQEGASGLFIEGDLGDRARLSALFEEGQLSAVMHFAASIDLSESLAVPSKYYWNNLVSTLSLLDEMVRHAVPFLIFSSSAAVYGDPKSSFVGEEHPCRPINPYGRSKLFVEELLRDYQAAYGLQFTSLRYFNVAGVDRELELKPSKSSEKHLIPRLLEGLKRGEREAVLFGADYPTRDGTCIRDYVHIKDLVRAHLLSLERLLAGGGSQVYNLGSGIGYSVKEVVEALSEATSIPLSALEGPKRPGDPPILVADSGRARAELGWSASLSLDQILQDACSSPSLVS